MSGVATSRQLNMLRCHCELRGDRDTLDWLAARLWLRQHGVEVEQHADVGT